MKKSFLILATVLVSLTSCASGGNRNPGSVQNPKLEVLTETITGTSMGNDPGGNFNHTEDLMRELLLSRCALKKGYTERKYMNCHRDVTQLPSRSITPPVDITATCDLPCATN